MSPHCWVHVGNVARVMARPGTGRAAEYYQCFLWRTCVQADQHRWNPGDLSVFWQFFFAQAGEQLVATPHQRRSFPVRVAPCRPSPNPLLPQPPPRRDPRLMCFSLPHNGLWNGEAARFVSAGSRSNANKSSLSRVGVVTEEKWEGLFAVCFLFKSRGHASLGGGKSSVLRSAIGQQYKVTRENKSNSCQLSTTESDSHRAPLQSFFLEGGRGALFH